ncbi:hypothetical protein SAMN05421783_15412 [Thiocapsa roseopersicina]|uniref:Uncharacterized protein n=1 Tax=Thiocapsa roseopersicina TaxID=1058 RepID=A0A1H3DNU9_THIRO|nr:hypothetical protein SAMN05421783_15412 [Thiocapsa roseopersicina]
MGSIDLWMGSKVLYVARLVMKAKGVGAMAGKFPDMSRLDGEADLRQARLAAVFKAANRMVSGTQTTGA